MAEMNEKMIKLAAGLSEAAEAYFIEYEKENGKDNPVIWVENNETKALVVYTRNAYSDQLKSYIASGMNFAL